VGIALALPLRTDQHIGAMPTLSERADRVGIAPETHLLEAAAE
jgi:hypothetical protein